MEERTVRDGYAYARAVFGELGVDTDEAIRKTNAVPLSMHCWQGDDVIGFDGTGSLDGGIASTGNYPGRARTPAELRADMDEACALVPGALKLNLHASYAEKQTPGADRDSYTIGDFSAWANWAAERRMGVDFNPTFFSHPMMDGCFSLSSLDETRRRFWVEHGKRCLEIGAALAERTGKTCVVNYWMPDGYKDTCADTALRRERMTESLDEIFAGKTGGDNVVCSLESKLFGVGIESYTVVSHEYALLYAATRHIACCLDTGHFHPTEVISEKITAVLQFLPNLLLHISRGVRWDSDHVVALDGETQRIMDEIVWNGLEDRVFIGMDYFDASINRIAAWVIGLQSARKALLSAYLAPSRAIRDAEWRGDYGGRFALLETRKTLPLGAVWDYYCMTKDVPANFLPEIRRYEKDVLSGR